MIENATDTVCLLQSLLTTFPSPWNLDELKLTDTNALQMQKYTTSRACRNDSTNSVLKKVQIEGRHKGQWKSAEERGRYTAHPLHYSLNSHNPSKPGDFPELLQVIISQSLSLSLSHVH